jgi:hypothetical protein
MFRKTRTRGLHPASYILHPASCILHPASCILHPVSCISHIRVRVSRDRNRESRWYPGLPCRVLGLGMGARSRVPGTWDLIPGTGAESMPRAGYRAPRAELRPFASQPYCPIAFLPYCLPALLPYCLIALLPSCLIAFLPHCPTALSPSFHPHVHGTFPLLDGECRDGSPRDGGRPARPYVEVPAV